MNARKNAASVAVQAAACANQAESAHCTEPQPLDLHSLYLRNFDCGYHNDLALPAYQVQGIARRLRGIKAITGILMAAADREALSLGDNLEFGLVDALYALATDANADLESANEKALKEGGAV